MAKKKKLKDITKGSEALTITLEFAESRTKQIQVDAVLVSIGRTSNLGALNLQNLSLSPDSQGELPTDHHCRVRQNIYAAGDVTQHPDLVNIAEMEGRYAVKHMFGIQQRPLYYRNMSTVMSIAFPMDLGQSIQDVLKTLQPHPTRSEGIQEFIRLLLGESIFKPHTFPQYLKIRTWHPERGFEND